jgi:multicomponent K+:H+ antiporter subunit G
MIVELVTAALILAGGAFALLGSVGLARLPDFFMRLHGPTKATTLGIGGMVVGSMVHSIAHGHGYSFRELAITLFLFITAPVSAHVISKAVLKERRGRGRPATDDRSPTPAASS